jgi:nicotinamidase/pyrazinamidase
MNPRNALVLVDIQYDFLPGGALAVPDGDAIIPTVNQLQHRFDLVVATQDWHPEDHASFAANHSGRRVGELIVLDGLEQRLWPVHCVQNSPGAELAAELNASQISRVFRKGTDPYIDSYSGFFDNGHRRATGLGDYLHEHGVAQVYIVGLASDYCVKFTALDALQLGFATYVIEDACRGVNLAPNDVALALNELRQAGVHVIRSDDAPVA